MSLLFIKDPTVFDSHTMTLRDWLKDQMPLTVIPCVAPLIQMDPLTYIRWEAFGP